MPRIPTTVKEDKEEYNYFVKNLGDVLTPREVCIMWGVSYTSIVYQMNKGTLQYRRAVSGGTYLLHRPSVVEVYGQPVYDLVNGLYIPEHIKPEVKRNV